MNQAPMVNVDESDDEDIAFVSSSMTMNSRSIERARTGTSHCRGHDGSDRIHTGRDSGLALSDKKNSFSGSGSGSATKVSMTICQHHDREEVIIQIGDSDEEEEGIIVNNDDDDDDVIIMSDEGEGTTSKAAKNRDLISLLVDSSDDDECTCTHIDSHEARFGERKRQDRKRKRALTRTRKQQREPLTSSSSSSGNCTSTSTLTMTTTTTTMKQKRISKSFPKEKYQHEQYDGKKTQHEDSDTWCTLKHDISSDFSIALAVQALEQQRDKENESTDKAFATLLQKEEEEHHKLTNQMQQQQKNESSDVMLAQFLQEEEDEICRKADPTKEQHDMNSSSSGKAVVAVQRIIQLVEDVKTQHFPALAQYIDAVAIDDMVYLAEKLLDQQQTFISQRIPSHIDIGYHYTNPSNMDAIRTNGLLTKSERSHQNINTAKNNGSAFGDGVYTANNPKSFSNFGDVGLLVGRLQGHAERIPRGLHHGNSNGISAHTNTIVGDKTAGSKTNWPQADTFHEIVLRSSSQCLPMVKYDKIMVGQNHGEHCVQYFQNGLQGILDELFNPRGSPHESTAGTARVIVPTNTLQGYTAGRSVFAPHNPSTGNPPTAPGIMAQMVGMANARLQANGVASLNHSVTTTSNRPNCITTITPHELIYNAPLSITMGISPKALVPPTPSCNLQDDCAICQDILSDHLCVSLVACGHTFHRNCLQRAFASKPQCPICRKHVGAPQGKSPSGKMSVSVSNVRCQGHEETNSIVISYDMRRGTQKIYHDNPGQGHAGKRATAYLPNNADGHNLLKRLKYAFLHGLLFTVGTSATTGIENQCTWSSIHHKTSPTGGVVSHGFPDASYFINCNEEMDSVGIPTADRLGFDGADV